MDEWIEALRSSEVRERFAKGVRVEGNAIAVFRAAGKLYAFRDRCPHQSAPISGGSVKNGEFICPYHGWRFKLEDGSYFNNELIKLKKYPVKEEDGIVFVQLIR